VLALLHDALPVVELQVPPKTGRKNEITALRVREFT
jgi:hypothetical protein